VPKAVATNGEQPNLEFVLDGSGLAGHFPIRLHGGTIARPKPDPEIYLLAAEQLGVPAGHCIVFEDSHAGVEAARAAGAKVVGIGTTHPDLPGVDLFIRDYFDPRLTAWLSDWVVD
jgi:beta-phosphoglucomutase-like phosphatase (HAD superfamily)